MAYVIVHLAGRSEAVSLILNVMRVFPSFAALGALALCLVGAGQASAQTATSITGLYYTGQTSTGTLATAGTQNANWTVTYASTNGGSTEATAYEGAGYVITPSQISSSGYTSNTSTAQWITAPGATDSSGNNVNTGGDFLPGNGSTGSNEGIFIYTLAFTITGSTGSGGVRLLNPSSYKISITMTIAADDQYAVYVNPTTTSPGGVVTPSNPAGVNLTGTAAATGYSAWSNTSQITLTNGGASPNANFYVGTNYISIVVDNTNSVSGASSSTSANASGVLVYQTGAGLINGKVIPEVGSVLPLVGAVGLYGVYATRRRRPAVVPPALPAV